MKVNGIKGDGRGEMRGSGEKGKSVWERGREGRGREKIRRYFQRGIVVRYNRIYGEGRGEMRENCEKGEYVRGTGKREEEMGN